MSGYYMTKHMVISRLTMAMDKASVATPSSSLWSHGEISAVQIQDVLVWNNADVSGYLLSTSIKLMIILACMAPAQGRPSSLQSDFHPRQDHVILFQACQNTSPLHVHTPLHSMHRQNFSHFRTLAQDVSNIVGA
jgi:hypothetical protein